MGLSNDELLELASQIKAQPHGSRINGGDWAGDEGQIGGCECHNCGGIFIGLEWRDLCKRCDTYKKACVHAFLGLEGKDHA